jgi:hypothetical protein
MPTTTVRGTAPELNIAFSLNVEKDLNPMSIPSGCMCTWVVRHNLIKVLKFESNLCPFRGKH